MVFGAAARLFVFPSFQLLKLIDVGEIFTRMELILAISYVLMGYLKTVSLAYASTLGIAQLFHLKSYTSLTFPFGMIVTLLAVVNARNVAEILTFAVGTYPLYALPFQLIIPLLTLVVAAIRRKRGASDADIRSASG
jgi:spore germination protein KB